MYFLRDALILVGCLLFLCQAVFGQVECAGWGELRGIRVDGQLTPISTRLCAAGPGWRQTSQTAHWRTRNPKYARDGDRIVCTGQLGFGGRDGQTLTFRQIVSPASANGATIELHVTANTDLSLEGVYVFVSVPDSIFGHGSGELVGAASREASPPVSFATTRPADDKHYVGGQARGARFVSEQRQVELTIDGEARDLVIQDDRTGARNDGLSAFFPLHAGDLKKGQELRARFAIRISGEADRRPGIVSLDPTRRGATFAGIGGNFCWGTQSPTVNFYLDNLRVAWARVNMPLQHWHPDEHSDPTTRPADVAHDEIREALRMATELHRRNIPMIIAAWNAPDWALIPRESSTDGAPRRRGGRVNHDKLDSLARSIASYLLHFKQMVGAEPLYFSFNEPNLGINVLQSPEEHRDAIKTFGGHFESVGLRTKLLLGDANEPRPVDYVLPTLEDPEAMKYVGAVSYHSWNGGTLAQLTGWRDHARRANLPLFVAEAGTDPDAHLYPAVFDEPWYALEEAAMYVQCMGLSQPASILHWQLTPDYGLLRPGTNAGDPPRMTQRWWQFKQLEQLTPADATYIDATCDHAALTVAALAKSDDGISVVHLVNSGGARDVTIKGLSTELREMRCHVTDAAGGLRQTDVVTATGGAISIHVPAQCFLTLTRR